MFVKHESEQIVAKIVFILLKAATWIQQFLSPNCAPPALSCFFWGAKMFHPKKDRNRKSIFHLSQLVDVFYKHIRNDFESDSNISLLWFFKITLKIISNLETLTTLLMANLVLDFTL